MRDGIPKRRSGRLDLLGQPLQESVERFARASRRLFGDGAQRLAGARDFRPQLARQRAEDAHRVGGGSVHRRDQIFGAPGQEFGQPGHLLVERVERAFGGSGDLGGGIVAPFAERGRQLGALAVDQAVQRVDLRGDRGRELAAARRPVRIGLRRGSRQRFVHRLDALGEPVVDHSRAAVGGVRQIRHSRVDDACAPVGRVGEGGNASVERLGALFRGVRERRPVAVESRADRRPVMVEGGAKRVAMRLEQRPDRLRMLAHPLLELGAAGFEPLADFLQRRDDLVPEPLHARAEGARDVFRAAGQRRS